MSWKIQRQESSQTIWYVGHSRRLGRIQQIYNNFKSCHSKSLLPESDLKTSRMSRMNAMDLLMGAGQ